MSPTTVLERPPSLFDREEPPRVPAGRGDDGSTLEDLVLGAWEDLSSPRPAACPVCRGDMVARYGGAGPAAGRQAAAQAVGGRCPDCGSELA
ncbi:MAG: hypothetical protein MSC31_17445 [Solirubrobacteraceae bacterium MAG38_C4-C5]|nr:hypothetical protein [Candidatus Siliceabacter maunaloa]